MYDYSELKSKFDYSSFLILDDKMKILIATMIMIMIMVMVMIMVMIMIMVIAKMIN